MRQPSSTKPAVTPPRFNTPPIILGCWQLSAGHASTPLDKGKLFSTFDYALDLGFTAFDCADIYTNVEAILGEFIGLHRRRGGAAAAERIRIHTKFVPDLDELPILKRVNVERVVRRSLQRLGVEKLDLVQFAWWDYAIPRYVETASWLADMYHDGVVANIGATNFDTRHLDELVAADVPLQSHQVQFSVLDQRPAGSMTEYCQQRGISLLCYGTVAGGLVSEKYLNQPAPSEPFENRSIRKYKLIVEEFGGWVLFQKLLRTLHDIAQRHECRLAEVAMRYVLDQSMVAAVILGVRSPTHLDNLHRVTSLALSDGDHAQIREVLRESTGPHGEVFGLERDRTGPHGRIMRYNLNAERPPNTHQLH